MHSPSRGPATIVRGVEIHDALGKAGYTLCNRPALRSLLGPLMHSAPGGKEPDKPRAGQGASMQDDQGDVIADAIDRLAVSTRVNGQVN